MQDDIATDLERVYALYKRLGVPIIIDEVFEEVASHLGVKGSEREYIISMPDFFSWLNVRIRELTDRAEHIYQLRKERAQEHDPHADSAERVHKMSDDFGKHQRHIMSHRAGGSGYIYPKVIDRKRLRDAS